MAGDWIEYEKCLPEKPEVVGIASMLELDRYSVVGRLLEIWAWFDSHTEDGNAVGVTKAFLDNKVGVTHFCDAMIRFGWLVDKSEECNALSVTDFEKHMGKSAKKRLKTAKRVKNHRKNTEKCNAASVTKALPQNRTEQNIYKHSIENTDDLLNSSKNDMISDTIESDDGPRVIVETNGRERFSMYRGWKPDQNLLSMACMRYAVNISEITSDVVNNHVDYWQDRADLKSEDGWCSKMVFEHKKRKNLSGGNSNAQSERGIVTRGPKQPQINEIDSYLEGRARKYTEAV